MTSLVMCLAISSLIERQCLEGAELPSGQRYRLAAPSRRYRGVAGSGSVAASGSGSDMVSIVPLHYWAPFETLQSVQLISNPYEQLNTVLFFISDWSVSTPRYRKFLFFDGWWCSG